MAPITVSVDVARPADEAFAYVTDPRHMPEWQQGCRSGELDGPTTHVGSHCTTVRRIGGGDRGIDGPIRALVVVTVEPLGDGSQSRVQIAIDFTGHGIGKLLVPLFVRRQAAKEMRGNISRLRQRLEGQPSA
jgi:uncharacterized protein YndB with AHSA1/START domain